MLKDSVLAALRRENTYVSGQRLSGELGVSRAAVNAAVKALRDEGCVILSGTNRGYLLQSAPDRLTAGDLAAFLPPDRMESVVCLDTVDSTNRLARELAEQGAPEGTVVLADSQTGGRGRLGRSFASPGGLGIYMSLLLRPDCAPADTAELTAWAAVAVRGAVGAVCGVEPGIKWVNDLVLGGRKLCGILTELSVESESGRVRYVIIGAGINVNNATEDFPPELGSVATSLFMETGKPGSRAELAAAMINGFDALRAQWPRQRQGRLEAYRAASVTVGRRVNVISAAGERTGTALGINDDFSLSVRYDDGEEAALKSGEVSVRGLYGYA